LAGDDCLEDGLAGGGTAINQRTAQLKAAARGRLMSGRNWNGIG